MKKQALTEGREHSAQLKNSPTRKSTDSIQVIVNMENFLPIFLKQLKKIKASFKALTIKLKKSK